MAEISRSVLKAMVAMVAMVVMFQPNAQRYEFGVESVNITTTTTITTASRRCSEPAQISAQSRFVDYPRARMTVDA
jgi:hypothetical protein